MMEKNYTNYNAVQLSADSFFLQWQLAGDEQAVEFWEAFRKTHPEKEKEIQDAIRIVRSIRMNDVRFSKEEMEFERLRIHARIQQKSIRRKNRFFLSSAVAASFALLVGSYFYFSSLSQVDLLSAEQTAFAPQQIKEIVLTLADEQVISFDENALVQMDEKGALLVRDNNQKALFSHDQVIDQDQATLSMNKLVVPRGRRSSLLLADGSKIWINSGTTLEFPSVFGDKQRKIKVDGEIYIEVAKNPSKPFIVNTGKFDVLVTGTSFNLTAYSDDETQGVVLVEGSVQVNSENQTIMQLAPNERFSLTGDAAEKQQVDVFDYISWKDGVLRFSGDPLETILTRLSRYYDVDLVCTDEVRKMQLRGKLALMDDITSVLNNIEVIIPINYEIQKDKIVITKK